MSGLPQRQSLIAQTVTYLKTGIAAGQWGLWLPGERRLCDSLQVSRNTLRAALAQLAKAGVIRSEHGLGTRIIQAEVSPVHSPRLRTVCVLAPHALEYLRPTQVLWIDELRALLIEHGCRLQVMHGQQYFQPPPERR